MANIVQDRFLTDKQVVLNSPGEKRIDIYYSKEESSVSLVEATFTNGRYKANLSNNNFSGAGSVLIPNQSLCGTCFLQVELPTTVANQTLARGFLFNLIDRVDYIFGSASVGNISLSGASIFQIIMSQCETESKRSQMLKLAGEEVLTAGVNPVGQIILPLPFSTACSMYAKKPYDTSLLSSPIQINVYFHPAARIYGGTGVMPTEMTAARVLLRQGHLSYPEQGIKPLLRLNPDLSYSYPIIHKQSFITQANVQSTGQLDFLLQQFIYADLLGIMIGIVKQDDLIPPTAGDTPNPFNYAEVEDFRCLYNGNVVYDCPKNIEKLYQIADETASSYVQHSIVNSGISAPFTSYPKDVSFIIMDFSRERQTCFEDSDRGFENVWRIANQTLSCTCNIVDFTAGDTYSIFCTYLYNGIIQTQAQGTSLIYYN